MTDAKLFTLKLPKPYRAFLARVALEQEKSSAQIVRDLIAEKLVAN